MQNKTEQWTGTNEGQKLNKSMSDGQQAHWVNRALDRDNKLFEETTKMIYNTRFNRAANKIHQ